MSTSSTVGPSQCSSSHQDELLGQFSMLFAQEFAGLAPSSSSSSSSSVDCKKLSDGACVRLVCDSSSVSNFFDGEEALRREVHVWAENNNHTDWKSLSIQVERIEASTDRCLVIYLRSLPPLAEEVEKKEIETLDDLQACLRARTSDGFRFFDSLIQNHIFVDWKNKHPHSFSFGWQDVQGDPTMCTMQISGLKENEPTTLLNILRAAFKKHKEANEFLHECIAEISEKDSESVIIMLLPKVRPSSPRRFGIRSLVM